MPASRSVPVALALSCHPVPTVAVTAMATVLAAAAGAPAGAVILVAAAVLTGQLSIGWSNDLIDVGRDRAAGRTDKPFASGALDRRILVSALVIGTAATVVLSILLGWRAGLAQLIVVACGWVYNLGLKATPFSPVPYAIAFGALPAVGSLARADAVLPPAWVLTTGALLGVAAHFSNVLPDLEDDRRAGVRGLPQRAGLVPSALVSAAALVVSAVLVLVGPGRAPDPVALLLALIVAAIAASVVVVAVTRRRLRAAFAGSMLAAAVCVAMLVLSGGLAT